MEESLVDTPILEIDSLWKKPIFVLWRYGIDKWFLLFGKEYINIFKIIFKCHLHKDNIIA